MTQKELYECLEGNPIIMVIVCRNSAKSHCFDTKSEVTNAINLGAFAVSTGKKELWYI